MISLTFAAFVRARSIIDSSAMRRCFRFSVCAAAIFMLARVGSIIHGQQPAAPAAVVPDVTKLGPRVGEKVPEFSLRDQRGTRHTLASLMGPKGLVLVFSRSADW